MTIPATPRRSSVYVGNGVATSYAFSFKVTDPETIVVTTADENDLNVVVPTYGVDFTVTLNPDQDASPGGSVTYTGLAVGHRLVITSDSDASQPTAISNLGAFHAHVLEGALDRIVILHQQQQEQIDRSVKVAVTSEADPTALLQTSLDTAAASAGAAAASETAAAGSASAAAASETAAAASAAAALASQTAAGIQGDRATVEASNAEASATAAAASAASIVGDAAAAAASASAAATSETNAAGSASAAATSATNAAGSASAAATSATNAAGSASAAATSETNAAASAATAATFDPALYVPKTGATLTGRLLFPSGSAALPAISWSGNPDTGLYSVASAIYFSIDGDVPAQVGPLGLKAKGYAGHTGAYSTAGATLTVDFTAYRNAHVPLGANCTLTFTAPDTGSMVLLRLTQDATGGRTVTWPANVKWPGGTAPTLSTAANAVDIVSFYYDGTNYFGAASLAFA